MPKISEELLAYFATLVALVLLVVIAMLISAYFPHILGRVETFGLGTVTGGLIGLMRIPRTKQGEALLAEGAGMLASDSPRDAIATVADQLSLSTPPPPQRGK